VIDAAWYLAQRSLVNALRKRIARLRQPKYLVAFFVGLAYFYTVFGRSGARQGSYGGPARELLLVATFTVLLALPWILGSSETPFTFLLPETQFLFTAPLTRRQVIQFKMLRSQIPLLVSAILSVVLFSRLRLHSTSLFRVIGVWIAYGTLQLHTAGAALVRGSLVQQGITGLRRKLVSLLIVGAVAGALWWGLRHSIPGIVAAFADDPGQGWAALQAAIHSGITGVVLWPVRALVGPLVATGVVEFAKALPAALLVAAAHYVWIMSSTLAFEEAAVEHAVKVQRRIEAIRRGRSEVRKPGVRSSTLFRLAPRGSPLAALAWKNVTGALREFRIRTIVLIAMLVAIMFFVMQAGEHEGVGATAVMAILAVFSGMIVILGPIALRYDLRRDLELLDVLKGYPLRGRELVGGSVLGPTALLSLLVALCLCGAFLASLASGGDLPSVGLRVAGLAVALVTLPAMILVLVIVHNAAALLFPAWTTIGPDRATGFEAMGQRILVFGGTFLALIIAGIPAAVLGGLVGLAAHAVGLGTITAGAVGITLGAVTLAFEGVMGIVLLGPVLERLDPSTLR
jgi:hypothetical protein